MKRVRSTSLCLTFLLLCSFLVQAKTTVTIATYNAARYDALVETVLPQWEKEFTDLNIEIQMYPDFWNKLLTTMGTDAAPDIVDTAGTQLFAHVLRGGTVDLAPYFERDNSFRKDDWFPHTWEEVRYPHFSGEGLYALPYNWVGGVTFFNKDHFDNAGMEYPAEDWTWEDLRQMAKKLTRDDDGNGQPEVWGTVLDATHLVFDPLVRSFGGQVLTPDRTRSVLNNTEAAKALTLMTQIILEDRSAPMPGLSVPFQGGKSAISIAGSWNARYIPKDGSLSWGSQILPAGPVKTAIYGGSNVWEVMRRPNQDMDAVWRVLKELSSLRTVVAFTADVGVGLPAARSYMREWPMNDLTLTLAQSSNWMQNQFTADWSSWQVAKRAQIDPVLRGTVSIAEGLIRAEQAINLILDEVNKQ